MFFFKLLAFFINTTRHNSINNKFNIRKKEGRKGGKEKGEREEQRKSMDPHTHTHTRVLIHTFSLCSQNGSPAEKSTPGKKEVSIQAEGWGEHGHSV